MALFSVVYSTTGNLSVAFLRLTFIKVKTQVNERRFVAVVTFSVTSLTTLIAVLNANNYPENLNIFQTCTGRSVEFWVRVGGSKTFCTDFKTDH